MKTLVLAVLSGLLLIASTACDKQYKTSDFNKDGTVEIVFHTTHLNDSFDIMTTTKSIYKSGVIVKTIINNDTLPSLGKGVVEGENNEGDTRNFDVQKDYNVFVTIK